MRRVSDGYTIIEVMIFLAISLVIAAASWNLISGKQAQTEFNQKMRDTQSKMQDWINDVSTGFTGGNPGDQSGQQSCIISGARPLVQNKPTSQVPDYQPNCIFLGKVIQFTDSSYNGSNSNQDSTLYAYPVFGCRLASCGANAGLSGSMNDANPEPAVGQNGGADLTESFDLSPAYVKSVCSGAACTSTPSQSTQSHLIGFMNSFNSDNTAINGAEDINAYLYNLKGNATAANASNSDGLVLSCIRGNTPGNSCPFSQAPGNPPNLTSYEFCLTDGSSRTAEITITSQSGVGASVNLKYTSC